MTTEPARDRARPGSVLATVTITAVVLGTGSLIAAADSTEPETLGGVAARYVPADGHLEWTIDGSGTLRVTEAARSTGYDELLLLPAAASSFQIGALGDDVRTIQLWRDAVMTVSGGDTAQGGDALQTSDLHRLGERGLELLASVGGPIGFAYSPALLELPADAAPGSTWGSAGDALPDSLLTYTADFTASEPTNERLIAASLLDAGALVECLQTDGKTTYLTASGELFLDVIETDLWCPGRGRVAIVADVSGIGVVQGPATSTPGEAPAFAVSGEPAVEIDWVAPASWTTSEAAPGYHDPLFGDQAISLSLDASPVRTASGLLVASNQNGDDVTALRLEDGALVRAWLAHPGGEILALGAVGDVVVATTSLRQVAAYSSAGVRLWTRDTDELVLAAPVDASEDGSVGGTERVAIVALDGTVMLLDAVTGDPVWRHGVAADVSAAPLVAGGTVVVVDRAGHRTGFRASDGKRLWSLDGDPASTGFVAGGVPILVGDDGFLRGIDTASGQELWSTRYLGFERGVADVDGVAILATDEQVIALDPDTGAVAWSRPGVTDAVTDGHALIVFGDDTAILLDGSGTETARWTVPSLLSSINRYALAVADGIVLFRSFQPVTVLGAP